MGRHSYLDEQTHQKIVTALKAGSPIRDACAFAGIGERTFHDWRKRGEVYDAHLEDSGEIIEGEDAYRLFSNDVAQARGEARVRAVGTLATAMTQADWSTRVRAAAFYLERTDPTNWGRSSRVEMTGRDGGPLEVADVTEAEVRLAAQLRERFAVAAASGAAQEGVIDAEEAETPAVAAPVVVQHDANDDVDDYIWPSAPDFGDWFQPG